MNSSKESGHAKNVTNFNSIVTVVKGFGTDYNPSNSAIQVPALDAMSTKAKTVIDELNEAITQHNKAINQRRELFSPLKQLVTRVLNALSATQVSKHELADADSLKKRIQGTKIGGSSTAAKPANAEGAENPAPRTVSSTQQGFDSTTENFAKLVSLLSAEPSYAPNETVLQVSSLTTLLNSMQEANKAVIEAQNTLDKARINRNKVLYSETTGMSEIAQVVKNYVLSLYGTKSHEYRQLSGISIKSFS